MSLRVPAKSQASWLADSHEVSIRLCTRSHLYSACGRGPHVALAVDQFAPNNLVKTLSDGIHTWAMSKDGKLYVKLKAFLQQNTTLHGSEPTPPDIKVYHRVYQNERYNLLTRRWSPDRTPYSNGTGQPMATPTEIELPNSRWTWDSPWYIDRGGLVDDEGYAYAFNFQSQWKLQPASVDTARRRAWCRRRRLKQPEAYWYNVQTPAPVADFAFHQGHVAIVTLDWEVLVRCGLNNVHLEGQSWSVLPSLPKVTVEQVLHHGLLTLGDKRLWLTTMDGSLYTLSVQLPPLATVVVSTMKDAKHFHEDICQSTDMQAVDNQWQAVDGIAGVCAMTCLPHVIVVGHATGQLSYGTLKAKGRLKLVWTTFEAPTPLLAPEDDLNLVESLDPTLSPISSLSPVASMASMASSPIPTLSPPPSRAMGSPPYFSFRGYLCLEHLKRHQPAPRVLVPDADSSAIVALSLNSSGCYMCCVTANGTVWGRFGVTKSEPVGNAWVPLSWRHDDKPSGHILHVDVSQAEIIPTLPSTPLEPGTWSDSVYTQLRAQQARVHASLSPTLPYQRLAVCELVPEHARADIFLLRIGTPERRIIHLDDQHIILSVEDEHGSLRPLSQLAFGDIITVRMARHGQNRRQQLHDDGNYLLHITATVEHYQSFQVIFKSLALTRTWLQLLRTRCMAVQAEERRRTSSLSVSDVAKLRQRLRSRSKIQALAAKLANAPDIGPRQGSRTTWLEPSSPGEAVGWLHPPPSLFAVSADGGVWVANVTELVQTGLRPALLSWHSLGRPVYRSKFGVKAVTVLDIAASRHGAVALVDNFGQVSVLSRSETELGRPFAMATVLADCTWRAVPEHRFVLAGGERMKIVRIGVSNSAIWAITAAGTIVVRANVVWNCCQGSHWARVECEDRVASIDCNDSAITIVTANAQLYTRAGVSASYPLGTHWEDGSGAVLASATLGLVRPDSHDASQREAAMVVLRRLLADHQRQAEAAGRKKRRFRRRIGSVPSEPEGVGLSLGKIATKDVARHCHSHDWVWALKRSEVEDGEGGEFETSLVAGKRLAYNHLAWSPCLQSDIDIHQIGADGCNGLWALDLQGSLYYNPSPRAPSQPSSTDAISLPDLGFEEVSCVSESSIALRWTLVAAQGMYPIDADVEQAPTGDAGRTVLLSNGVLTSYPTMSVGGNCVAGLIRQQHARLTSLLDHPTIKWRRTDATLSTRRYVLVRGHDGVWRRGRVSSEKPIAPQSQYYTETEVIKPQVDSLYLVLLVEEEGVLWVDRTRVVVQSRCHSSDIWPGALVFVPTKDLTAVPNNTRKSRRGKARPKDIPAMSATRSGYVLARVTNGNTCSQDAPVHLEAVDALMAPLIPASALPTDLCYCSDLIVTCTAHN